MTKSPHVTVALDELSKMAFGMSRSEALTKKICLVCKTPITSFRDTKSEKEYQISGMCQKCQNEIFGVGDSWCTKESEGYFTADASDIQHLERLPFCPSCGGPFKLEKTSKREEEVESWTFKCTGCDAILEVFND